MKIKKTYKFLISFLALVFFISPFSFVIAEASNPVLDITSSPLFLTISPPLWLASHAVSISQGLGCSLDKLQDCIPNAIISAVNSMLGATVAAFMHFAEDTLNSAISSANTFGFGFTPSDNPYISIGWGVVKNLANAILVLGLVAIAISIILKGQESNAKKLLVNFIIIALLINFTPVICGFIIDGSNIITASMLTGGVNTSYSGAIRDLLTTTIPNMTGDISYKFALTFITCLFCIFAIVIFFLYAILFFARTIILWVLVILSPIAFATFIIKDLPQSQYIKKIFPSVTYWDNWWESFFQWCVIGIPAGFSLYIGNKLLVLSQSQLGAYAGNVTGTLLAYLLPFLFLIVGFFITISTGSEAAKKLSPELASFGKKAVGWAGNTGLGLAAGGIGAAAGALAVKEGMTRAESARAGFTEAKSTVEKEGVFNSALTAGGKITGAGIGVMGGVAKAGKNWAIRESGLADQIKKSDKADTLEEIRHINQRSDLSPKEKTLKINEAHKKYNEKIKSYDKSADETILAEMKKGYNTGTVNATSNLFGGAGGGTIAAALGATKKAGSSVIAGGSLSDIKDAIKTGAVESGVRGADVGKKIADATIAAAGNIAVNAVKKGGSAVIKEMTGKVVEIPKEKKQTKEEWEEEAKKK